MNSKPESMMKLEPVYTFETVDPMSVRKFSVPKSSVTHENIKKSFEHCDATAPNISEENQETLFPFALHTCYPNTRLIEPIEVLQISPFLISKIKSSSLDTVGELLSFTKKILLHPKKDTPGYSQRDKIAPTLAEELYCKAYEYSFHGRAKLPWIEWYKVGTLYYQCLKQTSQNPSFKNKEKRYSDLFAPSKNTPIKTSHTITSHLAKKIMGLLTDLMNTIFETCISPWIQKKGGCVDRNELFALYCSLADPAFIYQEKVRLILESLASFRNEAFLFSSKLLPYHLHEKKTVYCLEKKSLHNVLVLHQKIQEFSSSFFTKKNDSHKIISNMGTYITKNLLTEWESCDPYLLRRMIVWHTESRM